MEIEGETPTTDKIRIKLNKKSVNLSTILVFQTSFTVKNIKITIAIFTPQKMSFMMTLSESFINIDARKIIAKKGGKISPKKAVSAPVFPLNLYPIKSVVLTAIIPGTHWPIA